MRKNTKLFAAALVALTAISTLSAETSGLRIGSGHTIQDDVYDLNNVITWNRLKFNNFMGFTSIDSGSHGNLAGAVHIQKNNVLGLAWNGNLWNNDTNGNVQDNEFTAFYGFDFNKALKLSFYEKTIRDNGTNYEEFLGDQDIYDVKLTFGMSPSDKVAFSVNGNFNYEDRSAIDDSTKITKFGIGGSFFYTIKKDSKIDSKFYLNGNMEFAGTKTETAGVTAEANTSDFNLIPGVEVQYKLSPKFTYGFDGYVGIGFNGGDQPKDVNLDFQLNNGFSANITDALLCNMGINTSLPSITFPENGDAQKGSFQNTFYAGFSFDFSEAIRIDASASITPQNGMSFQELWQQIFNLSIRVNI